MATPEPEVPLIFDCAGAQLLGILHRGAADAQRAVIIVVGGPQYRVGSHRQFVLLARHLAAAGIPTLRFDYRGMGDSEGDPRSFETIRDDIAAAIDCLFREIQPLRQVVLWGLCDAATAGALYAAGDHRIAGLVLLNPWVRTPDGEAKAYLRHYYTKRLLSGQFWIKLLGRRVQIRESFAALREFVRSALGRIPARAYPRQRSGHLSASTTVMATDRRQSPPPLPERLLERLSHFHRPLLLILSGTDLTAKEFNGLLKSDRSWSHWAQRNSVNQLHLPDADHTFSTASWRRQVETWTLAWLRSW